VGGVLAACGALCYGALARRIPRSGGEYAFLAAAVHPGAGFVAGWISLLAGFTAPIAAAALGFEAYLAAFADVALPPRAVATAAIAAAALLHGVRVAAGAAVQNGAVALKLALIAGFVALGVAAPPEGAGLARSAGPGWSPTAFALVVVWVSYAYSGWNAAVYVAEEVREPARTLPRALLLGTGVATAAYLALNAVFLSAAPPEALAGRVDVGAAAAEAIGGAPLRRAMAGLVALALATSLSSSVMAGPRVLAAMAADGLLPRRLAPAAGAPRAAMALQVGLAVAAVWIAELAQLLGYVGFTLALSAAATVGALVRLRLREGSQRVPVPGWPFVPALYLTGTLGSCALMALREPLVTGAGAATAALGVPLYLLARRRV
jgi:APA family basic amino acid/polyamine antiporter